MLYQSFAKFIIKFIGCFFLISQSYAVEVPIYDFPIDNYSQNINDYLPQQSPDYAVRMLSQEYQLQKLDDFYNHYYSTDASGLSPWSSQLVLALLSQIKALEVEVVNDFDNEISEPNKKHYGANFKEHDAQWFNKIKQKINFEDLDTVEFKPENLAITTANTFARALPDNAFDFYHFSLAGEGFPFDNLQESAVWVGTPLYVFALTNDKAWALVLTPDAYIAWVPTKDIAYASTDFIQKWQNAAKSGLVATTKTQASIVDRQNQFQIEGYIGSVFPLQAANETMYSILIPIKNERNQALIKIATIDKSAASVMPLPFSKQNMAILLSQLQNRTYGWGGMFFFNDCSQEMKTLFTPFGIWLPRNSKQQSVTGHVEDYSDMNMDQRLNVLNSKAHALLTIVYVGGHVLLYVGSQTINHEQVPISYQNMWGLAPVARDKRFVIGQSLFLPILKNYPEYPDAKSHANGTYFKLIYLDQNNQSMLKLQNFAKIISWKNDNDRY